jgi:hypothetical protein
MSPLLEVSVCVLFVAIGVGLCFLDVPKLPKYSKYWPKRKRFDWEEDDK